MPVTSEAIASPLGRPHLITDGDKADTARSRGPHDKRADDGRRGATGHPPVRGDAPRTPVQKSQRALNFTNRGWMTVSGRVHAVPYAFCCVRMASELKALKMS